MSSWEDVLFDRDLRDPFAPGVELMNTSNVKGTVIDMNRFREAAHERARLASKVIDLTDAGRTLDGVPCKALYRFLVRSDVRVPAQRPNGAFARLRDGEWVAVDPKQRAWHAKQGHDVRFVRIIPGGSDV